MRYATRGNSLCRTFAVHNTHSDEEAEPPSMVK
ncbi:hypothetical protein HDG38_002611 [Paraburkholderia sp. WSM4177]|nr:hypothetical protein [Paraburkholderia sp. WSM4177]MBB5485577.1 hypothetical protein [Paraburkholderia sp. WSM4180]